MSNLFQKPAVVIALGVASGLAAGVGWVWRAGQVIAAATPVAAGPETIPAEKSESWDFWSAEMDNITKELKEERERLRSVAAELDRRATRLDAERQELVQVRSELDGMRKEISDRVSEMGADEARNLKSLATTYSNLTPRAAVAVIRELDERTAVKILVLMKPDVVSAIFEEMSRTPDADGTLAKRAASLSERLRLARAAKPAGP